MAMTTADVLRLAAMKVEAGWCQNHYEFEGSVCAIGAINRVTSDKAENMSARVALTNYLGRDIALWNDTRGRTKWQVLNAFRECALISESTK